MASYRYVVLADRDEADRLRVIDLGAGHAGGGVSLSARVRRALRSEALLNESVSAGYLERKWPEAQRGTGAWPLAGVRKAFLDGSLTRLPDPVRILEGRIAELVTAAELGLASSRTPASEKGR